MELRIAGLNYKDILAQLVVEFGDRLPPNYNTFALSKDVTRSLNIIKDKVREKSHEIMELELLRLDSMEMVMLDKAMGGDVKAANLVLRIMERRSRYLGLDKPSQVTVRDWRSEVIELVKAGKVTMDDVRRELGDELAGQVIESGGISLIEGHTIKEVEPEEGTLSDEVAGEELALGGELTDTIS